MMLMMMAMLSHWVIPWKSGPWSEVGHNRVSLEARKQVQRNTCNIIPLSIWTVLWAMMYHIVPRFKPKNTKKKSMVHTYNRI